MRVAVVHDWLVTYGGAERVLEDILSVVPDAQLFSLVEFLPEDQRAFLGGRTVQTSFIQKLPRARQYYRNYLPLMPLAIEQFDFSEFDIVISSSYAVAKGVITGPDQMHLSYIHSPMRYAWDLQHQYLKESGLDRGLRSLLVRPILHYLRIWDRGATNGADTLLCNSRFIARRIWKCYRRESTVVYPPVDVTAFELQDAKEGFYLTASRLVSYKRIDLVVEAFASTPERRLIVIGDGPERSKLERLATPNVSLLGYQPFSALRDHMQRARAFIFAAEEDFGIVPVEAQACGTPVIAYRKGGTLETVRGLEQDAPTGVFFERQESEALIAAIDTFEASASRFDPMTIRRNAERFGRDRFRVRFQAELHRAWAEYRQRQTGSGALEAAPDDAPA